MEGRTQNITLRLQISIGSAEDLELLSETARQCRDSFSRVCQVGWNMARLNETELHKLTYQDERSQTDLPSQLVCSARKKACEAIRGVRARVRKKKKASCPQGKSKSIRYDARSATIKLKEGRATLATISRRIHVNFSLPEHWKVFSDAHVCSSDLILRKDGKVFLHVVVELKLPDLLRSKESIGIDLGVSRPAVTSQAKFLGKKHWKEITKRNFNLRRSLQAKGTRSAKSHLKTLGRRENRFRKDCDHVLSRKLVNSLKPGGTLVLEDLTNIRERMKAKKKERRKLHSWSFARLMAFLSYKADMKGCFVETIDPRYTSQKCSRCGHTEKSNRRLSWFSCKSCGFQHNADLNASKNILSTYLLAGACRC